VFEAAAIAGVKLFEAGPQSMTDQLAATQGKLALLPRARKTRKAVKDDF
jgi:hypothetical protein